MTTLQFSLFFAAILIAYLLTHLRLVRFEERLGKLDQLDGLRDRLQRLQDTVGRIDLNRVEELLGQGIGSSLADAGDAMRADVDGLRAEFTALRGELVALRQTMREAGEASALGGGPAGGPGGGSGGGSGSGGSDLQAPRIHVDATAGERILAVVESRLLALGYRDLRILGDLSEVSLDESYEIRVECLRNHMPYKGTVTVRNGGVADVDLQTAAPMFP